MPRYAYPPFPYRPAPELEGGAPARYPVAIVGAGPVGLAAAIDLALHGVPVVVLDDNDVVSVGSRAICWSKRTLEIFDRLGIADRMLEKGVTWKIGRLFHRDREVWSFDLLPEPGHRMPAFINLQQYYVEQYLVERCADFPDLIDLRWKNRVAGVRPRGDGVSLSVETPDGPYRLEADWVLACDGARSPLRAMLGLDFEGRFFEERFLIADVEMKADFPSERWFWFEPPFHSGQSALLHKQPDDIYRIDLQLGPDADPELERRPGNVIPRIERLIGHRDFELDWVSVYSFQCRRLARFVHGRVVFAGDSAHVVSPFGARGGNGGIQDVDNLCWKLALVVKGEAPEALVATYDEERIRGADENILNSARATSFMTPKTAMERIFRDEVLAMAADQRLRRGGARGRARRRTRMVSRPDGADGG
jgi:3-(3-hydroxy-phenyl)propionate hydroxylase